MKFGHESDELLMQQVQAGNFQSFDYLIRRQAGKLLTTIVRIVGDFHVGEDLFQEVVLRVWQKRNLYVYPKKVNPWLQKIAVNHCYQYFRRSGISIDSSVNPDQLAGKRNRQDVEEQDLRRVVAQVLGFLAPQQRAVVVLRIWQDMSYTEIAQTLEVSESSARGYMHQALKKLKNKLTVIADLSEK